MELNNFANLVVNNETASDFSKDCDLWSKKF